MGAYVNPTRLREIAAFLVLLTGAAALIATSRSVVELQTRRDGVLMTLSPERRILSGTVDVRLTSTSIPVPDSASRISLGMSLVTQERVRVPRVRFTLRPTDPTEYSEFDEKRMRGRELEARNILVDGLATVGDEACVPGQACTVTFEYQLRSLRKPADTIHIESILEASLTYSSAYEEDEAPDGAQLTIEPSTSLP